VSLLAKVAFQAASWMPGVATAEEVDIETLQQRLDEERTQSTGIYIGDVMFGACARKPAE
jgi:hypothetical protein